MDNNYIKMSIEDFANLYNLDLYYRVYAFFDEIVILKTTFPEKETKLIKNFTSYDEALDFTYYVLVKKAFKFLKKNNTFFKKTSVKLGFKKDELIKYNEKISELTKEDFLESNKLNEQLIYKTSNNEVFLPKNYLKDEDKIYVVYFYSSIDDINFDLKEYSFKSVKCLNYKDFSYTFKDSSFNLSFKKLQEGKISNTQFVFTDKENALSFIEEKKIKLMQCLN